MKLIHRPSFARRLRISRRPGTDRRPRFANRPGTDRRPRIEGFRMSSIAMLTIRVAMAASAVVGIAYVVIAVVVALVVANNMTADVDRQLARALEPVPVQVQAGSGSPFGPTGIPDRPFGPQVAMWRINSDGTIQGLNNFDIQLPAQFRHVTGPETVSVGGAAIRIQGASRGQDYVVVGETMEDVNRAESTLIVAEFGIGCALWRSAVGSRRQSNGLGSASSNSPPTHRTSCGRRSRSSRRRRRWRSPAAATQSGTARRSAGSTPS